MTVEQPLTGGLGKWTKGEWNLVQPDRWPFDLLIMAGDREVIHQRRWAHSSEMKTLADCMDGVGFHGEERKEIRAAHIEQVANATLIASAPELYEALSEIVAVIDSPEMHGVWHEMLDRLAAYKGPRFNVERARLALSRAKGGEVGNG